MVMSLHQLLVRSGVTLERYERIPLHPFDADVTRTPSRFPYDA